MGLDQNLYAISFNEKNFPKRFFAKDYMNKDGDISLEICELEYFRKNNLLQGYFERKHGVENCEYVIVSYADIKNLLNICDNFLKNLPKNFVQEVKDYYNLSLLEIIEEKLPITEGFFYGNYNLDIDYLISIVEIKEAFKNVEQHLLNNDKEKIYYYCWY